MKLYLSKRQLEIGGLQRVLSPLRVLGHYRVLDPHKVLPSKYLSWWRRLNDVFRLHLRRRLQDILIKMKIFALLLCLQKTSSGRVDQDQYIPFGQTPSRRLQDTFQTSWRHLQDGFPRLLQGFFMTSSRHLVKMP